MTRETGDQSPPPPPQTPLVVAYNPTWPQAFQTAKAKILEAIGCQVESVHHVGSTSVPGLAAKPIIDILVGVHDWDKAHVTIPPLQRIGWEFRGQRDIPRRHYFVIRRPDGRRTHHLHMLETTSTPYADMLAFRDHLRSHPTAATQYAAVKRRLATHPGAYQQSKAPFIHRVLCEIRG